MKEKEAKENQGVRDAGQFIRVPRKYSTCPYLIIWICAAFRCPHVGAYCIRPTGVPFMERWVMIIGTVCAFAIRGMASDGAYAIRPYPGLWKLGRCPWHLDFLLLLFLHQGKKRRIGWEQSAASDDRNIHPFPKIDHPSKWRTHGSPSFWGIFYS